MTSGEMCLGGGRYAVRGTLGEGAQGTTYEAIDSRDGRAVAIKRFDVRGARGWKDVELAEREIRVLSTLDHPLVPRYLAHFEEDGALYLVMEKIEGETLDAIIRREGRLHEDEVRRFLACADRALTYLHGRASPVVHRDIKPRNVVRRTDGTYVLVDFGTVSELLRRHGSSTVAGTIGYMAPEQLQGRAMPATDVYAVGGTALAALTGVEPETLPHRGLGVDVRAALRGFASPTMTGAIEQMLEPNPDRRPASLAPVLDGVRAKGPSAPPPPPVPVSAPASVEPRSLVPHGAVANEDTIVKSLRGLLWVLWGLGWVLVPVVTAEFGREQLVPLIMFGSLAVLFVLTWHKGAALRAGLRMLAADRTQALSPEAPLVHRRVEVGEDQQVRVHTDELRPEEQSGTTEVQSSEAPRARRGA
jgi:serine/threonine protein kinase